MSPLSVYKASAGSGKTFALTVEYLSLLFRHPGIHRHILAVTFTNKAAGEMKQRILGTLKKLSALKESETPDELVQLMEATGLERGTICSQAGKLLQGILNDYSGFSVGTIDRFFQSVIRAFTREIGIQPGYNLELDQDRILSLGVDRLFRELSDRDELQQWLIRFAEERLQESVSWNFRKDIVELGMQLFREAFQGLFLSEELSVLEKENLDHFLADLQKIESDTLGRMADIGREALDLLRGAHLEVTDFRQRNRSPASIFLKASLGEEVKFTDTQLESLENEEKWLNKDATAEMERLTFERLMPHLNSIYREQRMINTLAAIRQYFYTLGILGDLWDHIRAYTREKNLFLMTDSNRFLRGIIGSNQVPFIYERTGNRYHHLMLDEFQDTSLFQYENFRPLLDNALAHGYGNLVVGDVKQSIYRWRNSDWKILASRLQSDFRHQEVHVHKLLHNHRSREALVRFNNTVFSLASDELARVIEQEHSGSGLSKEEARLAVQQFRAAYGDAIQKVPDHRSGSGGMVKVELVGPQEELSFYDHVLDRIPVWIDEIRQSGIEPGEMAILVRTRREGSDIAARLLEHARDQGDPAKFRLISNESLLLARNGAVMQLIAALRFMIHPKNELNLAILKYRCYLAGGTEQAVPEHLFDVNLPAGSMLPGEFLEQLPHLKNLPLYELIEHLIELFGLQESRHDLPYLQAFQDLVLDLQRKEPQGIADFLYYWEKHGAKKGISVSESSNAIRILTIHKAKGLEFKAVLLPFCNWEITTASRKSTILWCSTSGTPFDRVPVVPVRFSSRLEHTLFSGDYFQERVKGYMDNLNLMYVAFTRAVDALYIAVPVTEAQKISHTGDLFGAILSQRAGGHPTLGALSDYLSGDTLNVGSLPPQDQKGKQDEPWQFTSYPAGIRDGLLKVRVRNDHYFVDEDGLFRTGQMYGNIMHRVFSRITFIRDLGPLLDSMECEGVIPSGERERLEPEIREMMSGEEVEKWFTEREGLTIYNERNLFVTGGKKARPDRVMIEDGLATVVDFKFGKVEKDHYKRQVSNYMAHLRQLGYKKAEGFLWYVTLGKIVQIGNG